MYRRDISLSPDGSRVAYAASANTGINVWVLDLARGLSPRISFNYAVSPQWSPDGKHLYFNTPTGIYRKPADGSGKEERLQKGGLNDLPASVSPDGNFLLYGLFDILTLPLTGERKPEAYLQTQYAEGNAVFSPDGRRVTYNSGESGRPEIYVQRFPERRRKWLASAEGGSTPQ